MDIQNIKFIDGNNLIRHCIKDNIPSAIGKIGVVELKLINNYIHRQYTPDVIHEGQYVAGIYPYSFEGYNNFAKLYLSSLKNVDTLAIWNTILKELELEICNKIKAHPIQLQDIEPYFRTPPWSQKLKNKKVLVISPFADTIQKQFKIKDKIWSNGMLPDFTLHTIKYPHANTVSTKNPYKSTIETINAIKKQMDQIDYDVAIIGVGAASILLAAYAKQTNKIGIHMGGPTQILFGIKGKRWDNINDFHKFYNDYWVRPSIEETPEKVDLVEGACYW